jgi:hypothetical protein
MNATRWGLCPQTPASFRSAAVAGGRGNVKVTVDRSNLNRPVFVTMRSAPSWV